MTRRSITVAIPVLGRPQSIRRTALAFTHPLLELLFLPAPDDAATLEALEREDLPYSIAPPAAAFGVVTYASKINHAYRTTSAPFLLYAADDVHPRDPLGWPERALRILRDDRIGVLSTNDQHHYLNRAGVLATHGIVRRSYVERHGSASLPDAGPVLSEAYRHAGVDVEISVVAMQRGAFHHAPDIVLEHRHWRAGKNPFDATYQLGQDSLEADRVRMGERVPEWEAVKASASARRRSA